MRDTLSRLLAAVLSGLLLAACGAPQTTEERKVLFQDGPEFAAASAYTTLALNRWDEALLTQDEAERDRGLAAADQACRQAQQQYAQAMKVYTRHQREEIETEMATVHQLRLEIERQRNR